MCLPDPYFRRVCVVIRISKPQSPCYHFQFLYDDEDDTIGRQAHSTAIRGPHPNPAQIPNSNKTRVSRPPLRIADSPWRFAASAISRPRPLFGLIPFAQPHPRKPSGLSQSLDFTPFARPHPRKPSGLSQSLGFTPFAQPHLRDAVTPLPALFLYRWPPAGVFEVFPTSRPLSGLTPLAQIHPRNLPPFYGIPFKSGTAFSPRPLARSHLRNAVTLLPAVVLYSWPPAGVFEVLPTSRPQSGLAPLAQPHPRNLFFEPLASHADLASIPISYQPHSRIE